MTDPYGEIAEYYDVINDEPVERTRQLLDIIENYLPEARTVLELGCGTGAVLAGLGSNFELVGVDKSPAMTAIAQRRVPMALIVTADMTTVQLDERFDVVLCVLDTINHLTTELEWRQLLDVAARHLRPGGLLCFDCNTRSRITALIEASPWVYEFDEHTLISSVETLSDDIVLWRHRLFLEEGELHRRRDTEISERIVGDDAIRELVSSDFDVLACEPVAGDDDDIARMLYVTRRR